MQQLVNEAAKHFKAMMADTREQLRQMQGSPIGTERRSPQMEAALWRKITGLEDPEFNAVMDGAAEKAGHQNDEKEPCELCQFVMKHAARSKV